MKFSHRFTFPLAAVIALMAVAQLSQAAGPAFIIVDAETGTVLQSQDAKQKGQIGSVTKIATAMVVLDWAERKGGDLGQIATIPQEAFAGAIENNIGFQPGDTVELRDLL